MTRRRRRLQAALFLIFVAVPLIEIYLLVQVGQVIGAGWTIGLLLLSGFLGAWLIRHEGGRAWLSLRDALETGRMPARELADGALILIGGTLMVAPGLITDGLGVLMILPFTRPLFRGVLTAVVARRLVVDVTRPGPGPAEGPIVRGEVVDDDE